MFCEDDASKHLDTAVYSKYRLQAVNNIAQALYCSEIDVRGVHLFVLSFHSLYSGRRSTHLSECMYSIYIYLLSSRTQGRGRRGP